MAIISRKWVHSGGVVRLAYSRDGSLLYTAGGDHLVRVFSGDPSQNDEESLHKIEPENDSEVLCMDCSMESMVAGYETGEVALFDQSTHEFTGLVTRSALGLAIHAVAFSPNGQRVAVASDEVEAKVIDVRDISKLQALEGHTKAIRGISWSPDGQLVTTSSEDGAIRVWDVSKPSEQEPTCLRILDGLLAAKEVSNGSQCTAVWHPSGKYFVVATQTHEIAIISRETWERDGAFEAPGLSSKSTSLAFSPNGRYLCSVGTDEEAQIWDCSARRIVLRSKIEAPSASSLAWRPGAGGNSICWMDPEGYLTRWDDVVPASLPHPNDAPAAGAASRAGAPVAPEKPQKRRTDTDLDEDDLDLEIGGDSGERGLRLAQNDDDDDDDGFIENDEDDAIYQSKRNRYDEMENLPPPLDGRPARSFVFDDGVSSSLVRGQEPFQPGSTTLKDKRRYLAFNTLGVIHVVERDTHNIVNIDFHDQSNYTSVNFDDYDKFRLAALGPQGAVFAATNKDRTPIVKFTPFEAWGTGSSGDWQYELASGEVPTALAIGGNLIGGDDEIEGGSEEVTGSGTVVVATSRHYLRFFTASGSQKYVVNFGEQIVALSASKEWLMIAHRTGEFITPGLQDLSYTLLDLDTYEIVQKGKLPLPKKTTLSWIGFAENQTPYLYDSKGVLSSLIMTRRPGQARWVPMLDTDSLARKEEKQESYWAVGVSGNNFLCVILKGQERAPGFPTPITQDIPLQIPLLKTADNQNEAEAQVIQSMLAANEARDRLPADELSSAYSPVKGQVSSYELEMDKGLLRLIQAAAKRERTQQALDLARMLNTKQALQGCVKIGQMYSLTGFISKIEALLDIRNGEYASFWRRKLEKQKRDGKYSHLVDSRTIPDSSIELASAVSNHKDSRDPFAQPFQPAARAKKTSKAVFTDAPARAASVIPMPHPQTARGSGVDSEDDNEPITYEEEEDRANSVVPEELLPTQIASVKTRYNPFAKGAQPARSTLSSTSVFAKSGTGLKKTDSFFTRVDASNEAPQLSGKPKAKKQSTLFGLPAAPEEETEKKKGGRGRKRKSDVAESGTESQSQPAKKEPKKLDTFFRGGASQQTEVETQVVRGDSEILEDTQPIPEPEAETQLIDDEMTTEPEALDEGNSTETVDDAASEPVTPAALEIAPFASPKKTGDGLTEVTALDESMTTAAIDV